MMMMIYIYIYMIVVIEYCYPGNLYTGTILITYRNWLRRPSMAAMLRRAAHAGALPAARRRAKHSLALPRLAELRDAARLIRTTVPPTPQYAWPLLAQDAGCAEVWVKHENHTRVGAFKVRGGLVYVDWLRRAHPEVRGLVAATRGNHGQSLALAARLGGLSCTIVVPRANSAEKNAAMASLGAQLVEHGEDFQDALEHAHALARGSAALHLVPSFHPLLVAGVGTWALELLQAAPRLQRLYVPIGLGSGVCGALAAKDALGHACEVVGVVSTAAPAYALSLARGACIAHAATTRIADGMACRQPDAGALELLAARALRVVTVDDDAVEDAMRAIFRATHNVAEGAGAAGYAALKAEAASARGAAVAGFVLCGGNVDSDVFARVLASGAARRASNGLPLMGAIGKPVPVRDAGWQVVHGRWRVPRGCRTGRVWCMAMLRCHWHCPLRIQVPTRCTAGAYAGQVDTGAVVWAPAGGGPSLATSRTGERACCAAASAANP